MQKKILLIDDDQTFIESLKRLLEDNDYNVVFSYSGNDGYAMAESELPDLILLDLLMPSPDGYETYKKIKEGEKTFKIPVIMLTGVTRLKDSWEDLYNDRYLCKPVDYDVLLASIKEVLNQ